MKSSRSDRTRPGYVAPLIALLLVPLLGCMAFSIDIGYVVYARSELVNTADAAALGGSQQLYQPYQQWLQATSVSRQNTIKANAITLARATAIAIANNNMVTKANVQIVASDVDVGYTDSNGNYVTASSMPASAFPNTVKITARRDNTSLPDSNGEVQLFFGPVLGKKSLPLEASSTAVAYGGTITNFTFAFKPGPGAAFAGAGSSPGSSTGSSSTGVGCTLLPVAVDITHWADFYANGVNSAYADPNAPGGVAWFQIYPGGTGASMDGLLSLNGTKSAAQTFYSGTSGWVQAGPSAADLAGLANVNNLPLPTSGTGATWASGPGMKSSLLTDWQAVIRSPPSRLLPLFDPNSPGTTTGGNGTYQICYFVPVHVVYAQLNGKANQDIAVIPAPGNPLTDPTVVVSNAAPLSSSTIPGRLIVPIAAKVTH